MMFDESDVESGHPPSSIFPSCPQGIAITVPKSSQMPEGMRSRDESSGILASCLGPVRERVCYRVPGPL